MNHLKKLTNLPYICGGLGLIGMALRYWQLTAGLDEKGLLVTSHPAGYLLLVLAAVTVAVVIAALWGKEDSKRSGRMFPASKVGAAVTGLACIGLAISVWNIFQNSQASTLKWVTCLLGLASVAATGFLACCRYQGLRPHYLFRGVVMVYLMLHFVNHYQTWFSQPLLALYAPQLLAHVLLVMACYHRTALEADLGSRRRYIASSHLAAFLCLINVPVEDSLFYLTMGAWLLLDAGRLRLKKAELKADTVPEQPPEEEA